MKTHHRRFTLTIAAFAASLFLLCVGFSNAILADSVYEVKGKVKAVSNKAKTISVSVKDKGAMIFKFNDNTQYIHAESAKAFKKGEGAVVKYKTVGPDMVAVEIKKAIAAIPEGVEVLDTPAVAALVEEGPDKGNYRLIDARPARRYNEGHIPTAISVPFMQLKKEGKSLLPAKGKTLIFYCGGPT